MANIAEYLDWRGDVPFYIDPFNNVDNLILSELSYVDFGGIVPTEEEGASVTIEEVSQKFFSLHTDEEIKARPEFTRLAPFLIRQLAVSKRFEGLRLSRYINLIDVEKEAQFSAITFTMPGITYIAFRGTDTTIVGWKEDLNMSYQYETTGQKSAVAYLERNGKDAEQDLYVGGHSKGGNFAVYAATFCNDEIKEKIKKVYSNDGPGFVKAVTETEEYKKLIPRIQSIIPEGSMIGILLSSDLEHEVVKSSEKGIMQHDALSWQTYGNHFDKADERTYGSLFMDRTVHTWLEGMSLADRKLFIDAMFSFMTQTDALTFPELIKDKTSFITEVMKSMGELPKSEQQEFFGLLVNLAKAGKNVLLSDVKAGVLETTQKGTEELTKVKEATQKKSAELTKSKGPTKKSPAKKRSAAKNQ